MTDYGKNIFSIITMINEARLKPAEQKILLAVLDELNRNYWKPVNLPISYFTSMKGLKNEQSFCAYRKALVNLGWLSYVEGTKKSANDRGKSAQYDLGFRFGGKNSLPYLPANCGQITDSNSDYLPANCGQINPLSTCNLQAIYNTNTENPILPLKTEEDISSRLTDLDVACVNAETAADDSSIVSREDSPSRPGDESEAAAPDPINTPVIKDLKPAFGSMDPDSDEFDDAVCAAYSSSPEPITAQSAPPATETPQSQFAPGSYDWMEEQKALSFQRTLREYIAFCHPNDLVLVYPEYKDKFDALVALGAPVQPKLAADMTLGDAWDSVAAVYPTVKFELNDKDREYYKFAGENWDQLSQRKRVNVLLSLKRKRQNGCTPYGAVNDEFDPNGLQQELWRAKSGKIRNDDFSEDPFASDKSNTTADMFA